MFHLRILNHDEKCSINSPEIMPIFNEVSQNVSPTGPHGPRTPGGGKALQSVILKYYYLTNSFKEHILQYFLCPLRGCGGRAVWFNI